MLFAWIYTLCKVFFPLLFIQCFEPIGIMQITLKYQVGDIWCWKINCAEMFWLNQKYQCFIIFHSFVFILANHFLKVKAVTNSDLLVKKKGKILGIFFHTCSVFWYVYVLYITDRSQNEVFSLQKVTEEKLWTVYKRRDAGLNISDVTFQSFFLH